MFPMPFNRPLARLARSNKWIGQLQLHLQVSVATALAYKQILFTNKSIADIIVHVLILPNSPDSTTAEIDVILGCHKSAELFRAIPGKPGIVEPYNDFSLISFYRVYFDLQQLLCENSSEFAFR